MGESGLRGSRVGVARAVPAREAPSCLLPAACPCHHTPLGRKRCPPKGQGRALIGGGGCTGLATEFLWSFPEMEGSLGRGR